MAYESGLLSSLKYFSLYWWFINSTSSEFCNTSVCADGLYITPFQNFSIFLFSSRLEYCKEIKPLSLCVPWSKIISTLKAPSTLQLFPFRWYKFWRLNYWYGSQPLVGRKITEQVPLLLIQILKVGLLVCYTTTYEWRLTDQVMCWRTVISAPWGWPSVFQTKCNN